MFKKSISIVAIQIIGLITGLLSMYIIVGNIDPEVYSLVGVNSAISGIFMTFSDLGIETVMIREVLYWIEHGEQEKVKVYASQALLSRLIGILFLLPLTIVYVLYLYLKKYKSQYLGVLILYVINAVISTLNNSMSLMVRSKGGYVFAQLTRTINQYFSKFVGIAFFLFMGTDAYLYFIGLANIPLLIVFFMNTRKMFALKHANFIETIKKIWEFKFWWIKTDLDYSKSYADSLIVSALFPTNIMGSYTIFKSIEEIAKNTIEGFFDVVVQESVRNKGNYDVLVRRERKIKKASYIFIMICIIGLIIFTLNSIFFIDIVRFSKYDRIKELIICVFIISVIHLLGKYEINAISTFASSQMNFTSSFLCGITSILAFAVVLLKKDIYGIILYKIIVYSIYSFVAIYLFKKNREILYRSFLR